MEEWSVGEAFDISGETVVGQGSQSGQSETDEEIHLASTIGLQKEVTRKELYDVAISLRTSMSKIRHTCPIPLQDVQWTCECPLDISVRPLDEWTFECPLDISVCPMDEWTFECRMDIWTSIGRLDIQMSNGHFDMSIRPLDEWTYPNVRWTFRYVHLSTG